MDYKEKLRLAKEALDSGSYDKETIEYIFPELKENEDERIRKELIAMVKLSCTNGEDVDKKIAWLEKQGEQKVNKCMYSKDNYTDEDREVLCDGCEEDCKLKQKPVDKVEPKFKVGDWVVYCGKTCKITRLQNGIFTITNQDGSYFFNQVESTTEPVFHFWTIQDAKDGDMLEFGDHGRLVVGIVSYVGGATGKVDVYCLLENNIFKVGNYYGLDTIKPHPATKEQRDALMKKMADAGWEFDFDKKELKKIEQNHTWSEENEKMINTVISDLERHGGKEGSCYSEEINFLKSIKDRVQPKQEWSEEDKSMMESILSKLRLDENVNSNEYYKYHHWLKSLKDRVQPQQKQEWDEEDEIMLENIIKHFIRQLDSSQSTSPVFKDFSEKIDWLKSIRPQSHWKPSDEQMDILWDAIVYVEGCNSNFKGSGSVLENLYSDLKKLKGE